MTGLWPRRVLPVLMFHRIGRGAGDPGLWISKEVFRKQLDWIAQRQVRTVTLDEAFEIWSTRSSPPRRAVLLTFDDAFSETLESVLPELEARGMTAAVFAPAGLLGRAVRWEHPELGPESATGGGIADEAALARWHAAGHGVGAHGFSHRDLCSLPAEAVREELTKSRQRLESLLEAPVRDVAYPFTRHDEEVREAAAAAGYRAGYAGEPPRRDVYAIPRMMVTAGDGARRFARKLSGRYYWWSAWHRRWRRVTGRADA